VEKINNYLILFADLIGSTEVAAEVTPSFFARTYIASYHWAARQAKRYIEENPFEHEKFQKKIDFNEIRISGDEVLSFSSVEETPNNKPELEDMIASAVAFAYVMKLYWLASPYNLRRMLDKQFPRDIAVGIHIGPAVTVPSDKDEKVTQIASFHINVTKRIENKARAGSESKIFASYDVADMFKGWLERRQKDSFKDRSPLSFTEFTRRQDGDSVKGVSKKLLLLELAWAKGSITGLMSLLSQLIITPEKRDIDAEPAAQTLANIFLPAEKLPFRYDEKLAIDLLNLKADTNAEYIARWFEAVDGQCRLFFVECWFVLNCYIISCAMLRHPVVNEEQKEKYVEIAHKIFERLVELIK